MQYAQICRVVFAATYPCYHVGANERVASEGTNVRVDGEKLRQLRERRVLSLRELAELAGVGYVTIRRLETGATDSALPRTVRALAKALGVEPAELIAWDAQAEESAKVAA